MKEGKHLVNFNVFFFTWFFKTFEIQIESCKIACSKKHSNNPVGFLFFFFLTQKQEDEAKDQDILLKEILIVLDWVSEFPLVISRY